MTFTYAHRAQTIKMWSAIVGMGHYRVHSVLQYVCFDHVCGCADTGRWGGQLPRVVQKCLYPFIPASSYTQMTSLLMYITPLPLSLRSLSLSLSLSLILDLSPSSTSPIHSPLNLPHLPLKIIWISYRPSVDWGCINLSKQIWLHKH